MSKVIESVFIEIKVPNRSNIIVGEIYRPPNLSPIEFTELFHALLSNKHFDNMTCFIMGDFNRNLLNGHNNPSCQDFLNLMLSKSFIWGNATKTLLDLLSRIQKRAVRNVNHARYLSHTNKLFHKKNRILKTTDLFYYNIGIFMYQLSANELPDVFFLLTSMFRRNSLIRIYIYNYPKYTRESGAYITFRVLEQCLRKNTRYCLLGL